MYALFFQFHVPATGREKMAVEIFNDAMMMFGKWAAEDRCHEPMAFISHRGGGVILLPGDDEKKLRELTHTDEFYEMITKARLTDPMLDWELMLPASVMMPKWADIVMHVLP
jgi:hypothetical protein